AAALAGNAGNSGVQEQVASPLLRYKELVQGIRETATASLPAGAIVAVVSRGDDQLLRLDGLTAWHFPQNEEGVYAGHHPADGAAAIEQLEAGRERGAQFLLIPSTAFWWLDHYPELARQLGRRYRVVHRDDDCLIVDLRSSPIHALIRRAVRRGR